MVCECAWVINGLIMVWGPPIHLLLILFHDYFLLICRNYQRTVFCWSTCQPLASSPVDTLIMKVKAFCVTSSRFFMSPINKRSTPVHVPHLPVQQRWCSAHAHCSPFILFVDVKAALERMMDVSSGPYDFGGILTNTNRDVVNGETVQKRNQAQKEMHW